MSCWPPRRFGEDAGLVDGNMTPPRREDGRRRRSGGDGLLDYFKESQLCVACRGDKRRGIESRRVTMNLVVVIQSVVIQPGL